MYTNICTQNVISWKTALVNQQLESVLTQVFTSHGALHIPLPLLMPKCSVYEDNEQIVMVMDHRGGVVTLPFDHRVSSAVIIIPMLLLYLSDFYM